MLKFFHKCGLDNGCIDIKVVEKNIDKHKDKYIAYVYKSEDKSDDKTPEDNEKESTNKEGGSKSQKSV